MGNIYYIIKSDFTKSFYLYNLYMINYNLLIIIKNKSIFNLLIIIIYKSIFNLLIIIIYKSIFNLLIIIKNKSIFNLLIIIINKSILICFFLYDINQFLIYLLL